MKQNMIKWISGAMLVVFGILFLSFEDRDDKNFAAAKSLDIYFTLFRELNAFYVDEIDTEKLIKTSIDKMLASLDPYTTYIPESEMSDFNFMTTGKYGGVGALIRKKDSVVVVAEPYEGFPADVAGLRAGDIFLSIDSNDVTSKDVSGVSDLLKGDPDSEMELKMLRPGTNREFTVTIERKEIKIGAVPYFGIVDNSVGYIALNSFTVDCSKDVKRAVLELKEDGAESIVLDLRNNGGGLLQEAVKIVNIFVPQGEDVVATKGRVAQWDMKYKTTEQPVDTIIPLVVLVNRGSASASEIVSGAIQDLDRGVVVGNRTFGKGLVQSTRSVGYNGRLKVTTAKYYIPSGRCIQMLDYAHRNEDGSVGSIPDSLITTFQTKRGREVKDGGGVMPDLTVEVDTFSTLIFKLVNESMIFDFANSYANRVTERPVLSDYSMNDDIYNSFIAFLEEKEFSYESRSQSELKDLIRLAKAEKYYDISEDSFAELEKSLAPNLERDLQQFKPEISEYMESELATRFFYQEGAIVVALRDDDYLDRAYEVLGDKERYNEILQLNR